MLRKNVLTRLAAPVSAFAFAATVAAVPALAQAAPSRQQEPAVSTASAVKISATALSRNPQDYYGKTVTVKQEVRHVLGPNLFSIANGEFLGTNPSILVYAPNAEAVPNQDSTVTVTGVVRRFTYADVQRDDWGWGAYPWGLGYGYPWNGAQDYWVQYENRPILYATSIVTKTGTQLVSNSRPAAVGTSGHAATENPNAITRLAALLGSSATEHVNQPVRLKDVTVDRKTGDRGFWTRAIDGRSLFVALSHDMPNLKQGERVSVGGELMKAPQDKHRVDMQKWGLTDQDVKQLMRDGVFLRARVVRPERPRQTQ